MQNTWLLREMKTLYSERINSRMFWMWLLVLHLIVYKWKFTSRNCVGKQNNKMITENYKTRCSF